MYVPFLWYQKGNMLTSILTVGLNHSLSTSPLPALCPYMIPPRSPLLLLHTALRTHLFLYPLCCLPPPPPFSLSPAARLCLSRNVPHNLSLFLRVYSHSSPQARWVRCDHSAPVPGGCQGLNNNKLQSLRCARRIPSLSRPDMAFHICFYRLLTHCGCGHHPIEVQCVSVCVCLWVWHISSALFKWYACCRFESVQHEAPYTHTVTVRSWCRAMGMHSHACNLLCLQFLFGNKPDVRLTVNASFLINAVTKIHPSMHCPAHFNQWCCWWSHLEAIKRLIDFKMHVLECRLDWRANFKHKGPDIKYRPGCLCGAEQICSTKGEILCSSPVVWCNSELTWTWCSCF